MKTKIQKLLVSILIFLFVIQLPCLILAEEKKTFDINKLKSNPNSIIENISIDEDGAINYTEIKYIDLKKYMQDKQALSKNSKMSVEDYIINPALRGPDPGIGAARIKYTYEWKGKSSFSSYNQTLLDVLKGKTFKYVSTIGSSFISSKLISIFSGIAVDWIEDYIADADAFRKPRYTWAWIEVYDGREWDYWFYSTRREYYLFTDIYVYTTESGEYIDRDTQDYLPPDYKPLEESYGKHFYDEDWLMERAISNYNSKYYGDCEKYQSGITKAYGFPK